MTKVVTDLAFDHASKIAQEWLDRTRCERHSSYHRNEAEGTSYDEVFEAAYQERLAELEADA